MSKQLHDKLLQFAALRGLPKAVNGKAIRDMIEPGEYTGLDVTLRIHVPRLNVGEDFTQRQVQKARPWGLLQAALDKLNGVTIDALVREVLDQDEKSSRKREKELKERANDAVQALKAPTSSITRGKVTVPDGAYVEVLSVFDGADARPEEQSNRLAVLS